MFRPGYKVDDIEDELLQVRSSVDRLSTRVVQVSAEDFVKEDRSLLDRAYQSKRAPTMSVGVIQKTE